MLHQPIPTAAVRRAEILSAFTYALDMTEGEREGHSIRSCWIAMQIGRAIGLRDQQLGDLYYAVLLKDLGCSSNAARICELYETDDRAFKQGYKTVGTSLAATLHFVFSRTARGKPLHRRAAAIGNILVNGKDLAQELIVARCTRGADIAAQLRFSSTVSDAIYHLDEHWDGTGRPDGLRGQDIPLISRIALLAQIADVFHSHAGSSAALDEVARRSGVWLDPEMAAAFRTLATSDGFWVSLSSPTLPQRIVAMAPADAGVAVDDDYLDAVAAAFGQVIDAKSPFTAGHSGRVALFARAMAEAMGSSVSATRGLRRAALLHDVGKLGVSSAVLEKPASLDDLEWVEMRGHADHTRAILSRIGALRELADIAAAHHERLDGRGYPHALAGESIPSETRIITVCDIYDALTADRPYRAAMPHDEAIAVMDSMVGSAIDGACLELLKSVVAQEIE